MKKYLIILFISIQSNSSFAQKMETFNIVPAKSIISWKGKKIVGGNTEGTILISKGTLKVAQNKLNAGNIVIDANTIQSEKASPRLIAHLKNQDFFDVEKHPTASFVVTAVENKGNTAQVSGDMTIKGITKKLSFPMELTYGKSVVIAKAVDVKIDRTQFDVKYRSGSVFSGLGDGAIEDNFVLDITLVAEK